MNGRWKSEPSRTDFSGIASPGATRRRRNECSRAGERRARFGNYSGWPQCFGCEDAGQANTTKCAGKSHSISSLNGDDYERINADGGAVDKKAPGDRGCVLL
jgi:hypothetical protein